MGAVVGCVCVGSYSMSSVMWVVDGLVDVFRRFGGGSFVGVRLGVERAGRVVPRCGECHSSGICVLVDVVVGWGVSFWMIW